MTRSMYAIIPALWRSRWVWSGAPPRNERFPSRVNPLYERSVCILVDIIFIHLQVFWDWNVTCTRGSTIALFFVSRMVESQCLDVLDWFKIADCPSDRCWIWMIGHKKMSWIIRIWNKKWWFLLGNSKKSSPKSFLLLFLSLQNHILVLTHCLSP